MTGVPRVGDMVMLPNPFEPGHPAYEYGAVIYATPGRVVSIEDGWAMVEIKGWGQFGRPVADLVRSPFFTCPRCDRTSHHPKDVDERYCGACHWWTGDPTLGPEGPP
jgi:hypothetical protein